MQLFALTNKPSPRFRWRVLGLLRRSQSQTCRGVMRKFLDKLQNGNRSQRGLFEAVRGWRGGSEGQRCGFDTMPSKGRRAEGEGQRRRFLTVEHLQKTL